MQFFVWTKQVHLTASNNNHYLPVKFPFGKHKMQQIQSHECDKNRENRRHRRQLAHFVSAGLISADCRGLRGVNLRERGRESGAYAGKIRLGPPHSV